MHTRLYICEGESLVKGSDDNPDIKFQIVPFENTPENAREILANLGKNIDVVGGIFDDTMLNVRACAGLELVRGPFHCAVSIHHRLAAKDKIPMEWDHVIPYGILHSPTPSPIVRRFLDTAKAVRKELYG